MRSNEANKNYEKFDTKEMKFEYGFVCPTNEYQFGILSICTRITHDIQWKIDRLEMDKSNIGNA